MIKRVIIINIAFLISLFLLINVSAICIDSDNSPDYSKIKQNGGSLYLDYGYNEGLSIEKNPDLFVSGVAKGPYIYEDQGNYLGKDGTMTQINGNESELYDSCGGGEFSNQVTEAYCTEDGKVAYIGITNCYNGCQNGACSLLKNESCIDTDSGKNYYTKGYRITQKNGSEQIEKDYCILDPFIYPSGSVISNLDAKVDECEGDKCYVIEYHCQKDLADAHIGFKCPNGCKQGVCLPAENITQTTDSSEELVNEGNNTDDNDNKTEDIVEEQKEIVCTGCFSEDKCYPFGFRKSGDFCSDSDNNFTKQKQSGSVCENDFECSSNACISGECLSESFIKKVINWFKKIFGIDNEDGDGECDSSLDCEEGYFEEPVCYNGDVAQKEHFFNCVGKRCVEETNFVNQDYCDLGCEDEECLDDSFLENNYCEELIPGINDFNASRVNLIFVGFGYNSSTSDGGDTIREMMNYAIDWEGKKYGLFSVEPFKSKKSKFNLWYLNKSLPLSFCKDVESWDSRGECLRDQEDIKKLLQNCPQENQYIFFLGNSLFRSTGGNPAQLSVIYNDEMKCSDVNYCQNLRDIAILGNDCITTNSFRYQHDSSLAQDVNNDGKTNNLDLLFSINCPFMESYGCSGKSYPLVNCNDELIKFDLHIDRLLTHEFGHQFGNLRDEAIGALGDAPDENYDQDRLTNCLPFANISECRENAPWKDLIGDSCGEDGVVDCTNSDGSHPSATEIPDVNENWAIEIDCYQGCKISGTYRSVFEGIMSDLYPETSYRYGLYNEKLLQEKLDTFSGE